MNPQYYTSLSLSKKLAEAGCDLGSENYWFNPFKNQGWKIINKQEYSLNGHHEFYPAYDILNDICVKHRIKFFGSNYIADRVINGRVISEPAYKYHPEKIFDLINNGKKKQVEDYIWKHCKFNPKNK